MNALNRLNAMAGQGGVAATGSSDQYYAWMSSIQRLQADVNVKCKASPGSGTYSGSAPYSGGASSYSGGKSVEAMRAQDRERDLHDARRRQAIDSGVELPRRP
jgi:hypothetical protein